MDIAVLYEPNAVETNRILVRTDRMSTGAIIGTVLGALAVIIIAILGSIIVFWKCRDEDDKV